MTKRSSIIDGVLIAIGIYLLLQTSGSFREALSGGPISFSKAFVSLLFGGPGVLLLLYVRKRRRKRKAAEREAMNYQTPIGVSLLSVRKTRNARPLGVTLIAYYSLIGGIITILVGATLSSFPTLQPTPNDLLSNPILSIIEGLASVIIAYGLFKRKTWGWKWGLIDLYVGSALSIASAILTHSEMAYAYAVADIGIAALIGYYLYRPHVKSHFNIVSNNPFTR